jgi:hypothetical protein
LSTTFVCPGCLSRLDADEALAGWTIACPQCGTHVAVPPVAPGDRPAHRTTLAPPLLPAARQRTRPLVWLLLAAALGVVAYFGCQYIRAGLALARVNRMIDATYAAQRSEEAAIRAAWEDEVRRDLHPAGRRGEVLQERLDLNRTRHEEIRSVLRRDYVRHWGHRPGMH